MYGTSRQAYIDILTELVKEETPTLYLEDYLYYYNKAISEYMKSRYELFEVNQQLTDDMRTWKTPYSSESGDLEINLDTIGKDSGYKYRHMLNCIVSTTLTRPDSRCLSQQANKATGHKATRMSSDVKAGIIGNEYLQPEYFRPYYEIIGNKLKIDIGSLPKSAKISIIDIEYLRQPKYVDLTECDIAPVGTDGCTKTTDVDTSQVLEFPKDVGEEILKVALKLILERGMNPRLQSNVAVNQSITDMSTGFRGGK
jgi:hypothetical protein